MSSNLYKLGFAFAVLLPLAWVTGAARDSEAAEARGRYTGGSFGLTLDGVNAGMLRSASGGDAVAAVVEQKAGKDPGSKKSLGALSYEPISMEASVPLDKPLADWISATWKSGAVAKSGALVTYDFNLSAQRTRQFQNAFITEVTIPACDGASKDVAYWSVKLAPERVVDAAGAGKAPGAASKAKAWLPANFRLEIDGIDTTKVAHIDAFSVRQSVSSDAVGAKRELTREPQRLSFPNLKITLAEVGADSFRKWYEAFVIKGSNQDTDEKQGRLVF
jgi:hypothetical protein